MADIFLKTSQIELEVWSVDIFGFFFNIFELLLSFVIIFTIIVLIRVATHDNGKFHRDRLNSEDFSNLRTFPNKGPTKWVPAQFSCNFTWLVAKISHF